jgi:hypothetical protein
MAFVMAAYQFSIGLSHGLIFVRNLVFVSMIALSPGKAATMRVSTGISHDKFYEVYKADQPL